jgi:hypothetical protein
MPVQTPRMIACGISQVHNAKYSQPKKMTGGAVKKDPEPPAVSRRALTFR